MSIARGESETQAIGRTRRRVRLREVTILVSVLVCYGIFSYLNPRFFTIDAGLAMLQSAAIDGLVVIGMTIVIVAGCFDLSVGSTMALAGLVTGLTLDGNVPVTVAVLAGLITGAVVGVVNGLLVTRLKVNPFITTLGTMSILRGIVLVATKNSYPTGFSNSFGNLAWGKLYVLGPRFSGIPLPIVYLVVATIIADILLRQLRYLRQVYFIGSNAEAANLTGIKVDQVKLFSFILIGVLAAAAGILTTAKADAVDPNGGTGAELRVIAAVIVGGASLSGGKGTILGSFLGLMLMQVISTGLVFVKVPPEAQLVAVGTVLILAAVIDQAGTSLGKNFIPALTRTKNKKMERIVNVALAVVIVILLLMRFSPGGASTFAGKTAVSGKRQTYVAIAAATGGPYWIDSKAGLRDKAAELGVDCVFEGPTTVDVNSQMDYIKKAIAQRVDGIIMIPMSNELTPAINEAVDAGIPVVCADADAPSSKRFSFVGTGNFNAGVEGGKRLAELIGGKGEVALIYIPGADNLIQRVDGYKKAFEAYPDIKVVAMGNDQGQPDIAAQQCRAILQAHPNLAGFGCVAATGGQGAAQAVKEADKVGAVKIVAMDRDKTTLNYIKEGVIQASIAQRTYSMTYIALQLLYNLRNGDIHMVGDWRKVGVNPLPPNVDTGSFLITKDNVRFFER
ncbi:MAG TPA: substrate-binding domain-containing protein [Fimbriimonadaceae bacterium]|nr:substrate-binding domain-containing protein [Fimbriimonadaceae bacterium]